jgi:radical SAM protein (TIGR01212 family)
VAIRWGEKRYYSLNYFLRNKFGTKVFKISLDAGFTCPNRDGTISRGGCIFCSARGSGDFAGCGSNLKEQFYQVKGVMNKKWREGKYIAYFQAYTNTYAPVEKLKEKYCSVLNLEGVVGIAIATRPDCLPDEVLDLLEELSRKTYVWVELGLQTIHEDTAKLINRGYDLDTYVSAVRKLKERHIDVVTHVILGLPGEDKERMLQTVDLVANTGTMGIKLHLLHLMKDTRLVGLYEQGKLSFLGMEEYIDLIEECIQRLPEDMVIHRLTGDSPRSTLIGPMWSLKKWEVLDEIDKRLENTDGYQGKKFTPDCHVQQLFRV